MPETPIHAVFAARLRVARTAMGISQAELGVRMGLPDDVASTRINRYEKAVRAPDIATAEGIAEQLDIPLPALVARDDRMARMIARFALLSEREQLEVLSDLEHKLGEEAAEKARVQIDGATGPASNPETADKRRF